MTCFLRALRREPVPRTPVWIMRQAGRYLPEYREVRAEAGDFMSLCRNAKLACEVTLQPLRRFKLDAAILFSDILTVPDALGLGLYFATGEGPRFKRPVQSAAAIRKLAVPDVDSELGYVFEAVSTIRKALDGQVPLIGFAGSPWTVATYMVEGRSSRDFATIKGLAKEDPDALLRLLDVVTETTIQYLNAQIDAGAQAIMVFDTWGSALRAGRLPAFLAGQHADDRRQPGKRNKGAEPIPVILFTKGAGELLADMAATGCDALGVDWTTDLATARRYVEDKVALQGNLDPATLRESAAVIRRGVCRHAGELRARTRARVQPRARHHAGHRSGESRRPRRRGARAEPAVSRLSFAARAQAREPRSGPARCACSANSENFDFEDLAFLHDRCRRAAMRFGRCPDGLADLEQLHALATGAVVLQPGTGLQVNHDAVEMRVQRRRLAVAHRLQQHAHLVVFENQLVEVRRNHQRIQRLRHCRADDGCQ